VADEVHLYGTGTDTSLERVRIVDGQTEVVAAQQDARAVALDSTAVYWINAAGEVRTLDKSTPNTASRLLASGQGGASAIALDDKSVFWVNPSGGAVWRVPKVGGTATMLAEGQKEPRSIAINTTRLYWVSAADGTVMSLAK
jgi:hypothetical protein